MCHAFCIFKIFFRVIPEKLLQKLPHKLRKLKHTPAYSRLYAYCRILLKIGYGGGVINRTLNLTY